MLFRSTPPAALSSYNAVAVTYGTTVVAAALNASPWVYAVSFSESTGFGSKYSDPGTIYAGSGSYGGISFN